MKAMAIEFKDYIDGFAALFPMPIGEFNVIGKAMGARKRLRAMMEVVVNRYRASGKLGDGTGGLLECMMTVRGEEGQRFSQDEILDNLVVLCFAGHDTTQSVMGTLVAVLYRKEGAEHLTKLKQEIAENFDVKCELDFDKLKTLPWLNAVIHETLRYRSTVTVLSRKALEDLPLSDGTIIPKGERFAFHPAAHHFDEAYWGTDAQEYNPQRF